MKRLLVFVGLMRILSCFFADCVEVVKVVGAFEGTPLPPYLTSDDVLASGDVVVDDIAYDDQHGMTKERKIASATLPQSLIDPHRYIKRKAAERPNQCNIDVKEATVVFMVDVGYNLPEFAVPNVKEFILSTLDVMELGRDRIQVGIVSMGSDEQTVTDALSPTIGTSHRTVQEGLVRLVKGNGNFNYTSVLSRANEFLIGSRNNTVIIIAVSTAPFIQTTDMDELMHKMSDEISDLVFYHVTLSTTAIFMDKSSHTGKSSRPIVTLVPEYNGLTSKVATLLLERYGCDFCSSSPCDFGAGCTSTKEGPQCECLPGSVSGICEPCRTNPCDGSRCVVSGTSHICDYCDPSPCKNNGECFYKSDNAYGFRCVCKDNFVGRLCELQCPTCENGGKCREINGSAVCECVDGFIGLKCDRNCQAMITCSNGGICDFDENDHPICNCTKPFHGPRCENLCDKSICRNGGSCGVQSGEIICYCTPQFTGKYCDEDKCETYFRCQNGGVCQLNNETKRIECDCVEPFTGVDCGINPCSNYTCFNGGTCRLKEAFKPQCNCPPPYSGENCLADPCTNNPCLHGGTCQLDRQNVFICICPTQYSGIRCQDILCDLNPCKNGGTCLPVLVGAMEFFPSCICPEQYTGTFCTTKMDIETTTAFVPTSDLATDSARSIICDPDPCVYPCKCVESCKHSDGFVCVSRDGRLGKYCSIDPPSLKCGSDAIEVTIDDQYLVEMLGNYSSFGYFQLGWNESNALEDCLSRRIVRDDGSRKHRFVIPAPFTFCGTRTDIDDLNTITISNKVSYNINSSGLYDMLTPVVNWYCHYTTQYTASASLEPVVDKPEETLDNKGETILALTFQLCKMTKCASSCPENLMVNPGGVYTVGQMINVIVRPVSVAGYSLHVVDFYLSCGSDPNSMSVVPLVKDGCSTNTLHLTLSKNNFTCIVFKLPRMRGCNVLYLHAKMSICDKTEICKDSPLRGCTRVRAKRSVQEIQQDDLFGPIYLLPVDKVDPQAFPIAFTTKTNTSLKPGLKEDILLQTSFDFNIITVVGFCIIFVLFSVLAFVYFYRKNHKY